LWGEVDCWNGCLFRFVICLIRMQIVARQSGELISQQLEFGREHRPQEAVSDVQIRPICRPLSDTEGPLASRFSALRTAGQGLRIFPGFSAQLPSASVRPLFRQ
jgi:hypothetical protein